MHLFTLLASSISPAGHRSFIQPEGMDNGVKRTSIRQKRHHDDDQVGRFAQPSKHRALLRTERFPTGFAPIAWPFSTMDHNIALPDLSSCFAFLIRAELSGSVHRFCLELHTLQNR